MIGYDITTFLKGFFQGNLFHLYKLKSYKNNVADQNNR